MSSPEKYLCNCGKFILLKKDGTFRYHTNGIKPWAGAPFSDRCEGVGEKP